MNQRKVLMEYHHEPEGWGSNLLTSRVQRGGATFEEVRDQANEGARFYLEEPVQVEDRVSHDLDVANSSEC